MRSVSFLPPARGASIRRRRGRLAGLVPPFVSMIGVFVDPPEADVHDARAAGFVPQFSGREPAPACEAGAAGASYIKVFHIDPRTAAAELEQGAFERWAAPYARATWMFDTSADGKHGGTGRTFDWDLAAELARRRPHHHQRRPNARQCRRVRPPAATLRRRRSIGYRNGRRQRPRKNARVRACGEGSR